MEPRKFHLLQGSAHPPTRRDRVIVLLILLGIFLLLLPEALLIHTQALEYNSAQKKRNTQQTP